MMGDRTANTLLKDVVLKVFITLYDSQSPTYNREEAIKKMLEAGEFVRTQGRFMDKEQLDNIGELTDV